MRYPGYADFPSVFPVFLKKKFELLLKEETVVGFGAFDIPKDLEEIVSANELDPSDYTSRSTLSFTVLVLNRKENTGKLVKELFSALFQWVPTIYHIFVRWADKRLDGTGRHVSPTLTLINRNELIFSIFSL